MFINATRPPIAAPRHDRQSSRERRKITVDGGPDRCVLPKPPEHPLIAQLAATREGGFGRGHAWRTLAFLLFDHIAGLDTVFYTLTQGGTLVLTDKRDPDSILAVIESHQVEVLPTSPSFLRMLCAAIGTHPHDYSSLEIITYGSELMDPGTLARLNAQFPQVRIIQKYGTTETGSPRTQSRGNDSLWLKLRTDDMETKVIDDVLWIRSSGSTLGYLNAPSSITEDGWYCTGDLVDVDGEWIRFRGRASDIINVGGEKVSPTEVEQTLLELDFVRDAVVFGEPHALLGQVVAARLSITPSSTTPRDPKEIAQRVRRHCRSRLAPHMVPIKVEVTPGELVNDRHKVQRTGPQP